VVVCFGLTDDFPEASERHYRFMLEGLKEVKNALADRGIQMVVLQNSPELGAIPLAEKAAFTVVDRGYLQIERRWRSMAAKSIRCPLIQVESNAVVPVEEASLKEAYSAAAFRPKPLGNAQTWFKFGLAWTNSTTDTITLCRGSIDPYWNYLRIRGWKINE